METRTTDDGTTLYVAPDEAARGSEAPFVPAYRDADCERRYGWYCAACGSFDAAMDTMGRVECNDCGNRRKPEVWDAAHE